MDTGTSTPRNPAGTVSAALTPCQVRVLEILAERYPDFAARNWLLARWDKSMDTFDADIAYLLEKGFIQSSESASGTVFASSSVYGGGQWGYRITADGMDALRPSR